MSQYINGPINVVRMEGYVGKIKKIIYVYFDFHHDITEQKRCEDITSIDISKYLANVFKKLNNSDKIYDFFLEHGSLDLKNYNHGFPYKTTANIRRKYIQELWKLFNINSGNRHLYDNDPMFTTNDKNTDLKKTKKLFTTRFHYVDIRRFFGLDFITFDNKPISIINETTMDMAISQKDYDLVLNIVNNFRQYYADMVDILEKNNEFDINKVNKYHRDLNENYNFGYANAADTRNYFINKIKTSYAHKSVKDAIKQTLQHSIPIYRKKVILIDEFIAKFTQVHNLSKMHYIMMFNDLINEYVYGPAYYSFMRLCYDLKQLYWEIINGSESWLMDMYTLRRILDKDYISNSIIYCGAAHSIHYVYFLTKFFDFKISHASYSSVDLDILNSEIKKCEFSNYDLILTKMLYPQKFTQCCNMTDFPPDFS